MPDFNDMDHVIKDNTIHPFKTAFTQNAEPESNAEIVNEDVAREYIDTTLPSMEVNDAPSVAELEFEPISAVEDHRDQEDLLTDSDSTEPGHSYAQDDPNKAHASACGSPTPQHLEDAYPGSINVSFRPPQQPEVCIFAVNGVTHLALFATKGPDAAHEALQQLLEAADWAREQSDILKSAIPGLLKSTREKLILDLFLERPADAMRWLTLLGPRARDIRPHLLKSIAINAGTAQWIHEPLY